ncbi:YbaB/EbfC family nucleoid-associated protein [Actinomadura montaniterrae]|uniref:YbaB/EbfC family nucleoid-associated protein n=1 Tax=Actinomadura montaniterrae TaxID=1803903 RepID=A0A6L3VP80_9ACTN|nr:YbaB/EbfC family nucleoid-associated protein [Actinomadura montaniterrae]
MDLDFSERALMYPQTLDRKITHAITQARRLAREDYRNFLMKEYPEHASWRSRLKPLTFLSQEERRQLGESNGKRLHDIDSTKELFERESITEKIDYGGGTVSLSVSGDDLRVKLTREAIRDVSPSRLGKRIVTAIDRAEEKAKEVRRRTLQSLTTW